MQLSLKLAYSGLVSERVFCNFCDILNFLDSLKRCVCYYQCLVCINSHYVIDAMPDLRGFQTFVNVIITHEEFDSYMFKEADQPVRKNLIRKMRSYMLSPPLSLPNWDLVLDKKKLRNTVFVQKNGKQSSLVPYCFSH